MHPENANAPAATGGALSTTHEHAKHDTRSAAAPTMLDAALGYARRGWAVFPISVESKAPAIEGGYHSATRDEAQIRAWWEANPADWIALPQRPNGLIAIDVDPRNGGAETLARLEAEHGALPRALNQRSRSGGEHIVMRDPGGAIRGKLGPGVDVKCNGYIVVEPSPGYQWLAHGEPPEVPAAWVSVVRKPVEATSGVGVEAWAESVGGELDERTAARLRSRLDGLKRGRGESATFQAIATTCHDFGRSVADGLPFLNEWNASSGKPHAPAELERQIRRVADRDLRSRGPRGWAVLADAITVPEEPACVMPCLHPDMCGCPQIAEASESLDDLQPEPPTTAELIAALKAERVRLSRQSNPIAQADAARIGRVLGSGLSLAVADEDAAEALAASAAALVRRAPSNAKDDQLVDLLARFAPRDASETAIATARETVAPVSAERPKTVGAVARAAEYVAKRATHELGVTLRRWRGDWYRWTDSRGCYQPITPETVDKDLYRALELSDRQAVGDVRHALIAVDDVLIDQAELPSWLDGASARDPLDVVACPNGLLHLPTMTLAPATPQYFALASLGVPFDPNAPTPARWLAFLRELWGDDEQSIRALQEWFGYLLTPDTRQQKILFVLGPKRSGKGTIMRVLTALLGADSVAAPTLSSLGTNFGIAPLIGRTAAIIGDARLGGRSDVAQIVERLLSISGGDPQTVDRKHREAWTGYLQARIVVVSNELPELHDASGALAGRMLILNLSQSFYGREDVNLTDELLAEMPGILRWAIDGWRSLRARGRFVAPESAADVRDQLADLGSPVGAWIRERVIVAPDASVPVADAYGDFRTWCGLRGVRAPTSGVFGRDLHAAIQCRRGQIGPAAARVPTYLGIGLRPTA